MSEEVSAIQERLRDVGLGANVGELDGEWGPKTEGAVAAFQEGFAFWDLQVDGDPGELTINALDHSRERGGAAIEHFRFQEFASPDTGEVLLMRDLARGLERLRSLEGESLPIVSGYRTLAHNASVGGAERSVHTWGGAADIPGRWSLDVVRGLEVFSGIGVEWASGLVLHVDVRHADPQRWYWGSPSQPEVWFYR